MDPVLIWNKLIFTVIPPITLQCLHLTSCGNSLLYWNKHTIKMISLFHSITIIQTLFVFTLRFVYICEYEDGMFYRKKRKKKHSKKLSFFLICGNYFKSYYSNRHYNNYTNIVNDEITRICYLDNIIYGLKCILRNFLVMKMVKLVKLN